MKKIYSLFIWCFLAGTLVSCEKEENLHPNQVISTASDYLPTTAGTTWTYGGRSPYTLTVTGNTKVINGKSYHELQNKIGGTTFNAYVINEKGVYTAIGLVSSMANLEVAILKEALPVGSFWEQAGVVNGINVNLKFTIEEKDATKIIAGKTFDNVINVKMAGIYTYSGIETGISFTNNYYFAKGIGLILTDLGANGKAPLEIYEVK